MERYHEIANEMQMTQKQRNMYFQLGATVQNASLGRRNAEYSHDLALGALVAVDWKSMKAAKAILTATRAW